MPDSSHVAAILSPSQVYGTGDQNPFPFDFYARKCLAQGDSWFSIGSLPPGLTSNVLDELTLTPSVAIVNCAHPGRELRHMTDTTTEPAFLRLLAGPFAQKWDALLLSGGGNDLIDAVGAAPTADAAARLLATPAERGAGPLQPADYLSPSGWQTFDTHLRAVFGHLLDARAAGINKDTPLLFHTYAHLTPRPAPAGFGFGPWLAPALIAYAVPPEDWNAVADLLLDHLATLLADVVATHPGAGLVLVETRTAGLVAATPGSTGRSGDFLNEIHPTRGGYARVATAWRAVLDPVLA